MKNVRDVCKHEGDCSVWAINPHTNKPCIICDCGALRRAIVEADKKYELKEIGDLWEAWTNHCKAIEGTFLR